MSCIDHGKHKSLSKEGYALVGVPGVRSRCTRLHRLVYARKIGVELEAIKGVVVRHTCDNTRCINPEHLIGGTHADNNKDRAERNRSAKAVPSRQRLSKVDVDLILLQPDISSEVLAKQFGVSRKVIWNVRKGTYTLCHG